MANKYKGRYDVLGRGALILMTLIWGTSFLMQKNTLSEVQTLYLLAFRFTGATLFIFLSFIKQMKNFDGKYVWNGIVLGVLLFLGYVVQTYGLVYTTPSKNAFLSAIYCVLVPFISWFVTRKKPDGYNIAAAFLCFGGVALVALKEDMSMSFGDMLTIISGLFYGVHIVLTAKYIEGRSVAVLTFVQFATAMVLSWAFAMTNAVFPAPSSPVSITPPATNFPPNHMTPRIAAYILSIMMGLMRIIRMEAARLASRSSSLDFLNRSRSYFSRTKLLMTLG